MSNIALRVEHIAKQYHIGATRQRYGTLRDAIAERVKRLSRAGSGKPTTKVETSVWALRDVGFEVHHGDAVGIIGRNGAGKSTVLKILSRVTTPSKGRAEIYGRVGALLEVGTGFHPELTGRDNIYLNGAILGMSRAEIRAKFEAIVDFSGVEKFLDTPVKRYSSGMHARLAFAVAAHLDPEILIVDEVLAVGDAAFQKKCLGKMGEFARSGRTVLFVSHNLGVMQSLCKRAIFLADGVVACDDEIERAATFYLSQLEADANVSLVERTDRSGSGMIRFHNIEITSGGGSAGVLTTGAQARLRLVMSDTCQQPWCGITIYDHMGAPVTHLNSRLRSHEDHENGSPLEFICDIDELPLLPGRYRLAVALYGNGEFQDHLTSAAYFNVEQGSIRGRPVSERAGYGRVILPHRWILPSH
jgi:lipopolysaccharide transport system ATP-binding protein